MTARTLSVHRSNAGQWSMVSGAPAAAARRWVVGDYVGWTEAGPAVRRRELPTVFVPIILNFGARWSIDADDGGSRCLSSFAAGAHDRAVQVEALGTASCLQVNLTFAAAHRLFRLPMRDLVNRTQSLDDLLGRKGEQLVEDLGNESDWPERFDCLDAFLTAALSSTDAHSPEVALALDRISATHGDVAIGELAVEAGWSRKKLIGAFRQEVGLPPKTVARVYRFDRAARLLRRGDTSLAIAALDCGYCDQAHFNRDFLAFAGVTPSEYVKGIA